MALGLVAAVVLARGSVAKAIAMVFLGLLIGLVGTDVNSGEQRFTFGIFELADGIDFVPIAMGLFGVASFGEGIPIAAKIALAMAASGLGGMLPAAVLASVPVHAREQSEIATVNGVVTQLLNIGSFIGPPALAALVSQLGGWSQSSLRSRCDRCCSRLDRTRAARRERAEERGGLLGADPPQEVSTPAREPSNTAHAGIAVPGIHTAIKPSLLGCGGAEPAWRASVVASARCSSSTASSSRRCSARPRSSSSTNAAARPPSGARRRRTSSHLMTPVIKAFFTDVGFEVTNLALQCYGGHGYIRDHPVEMWMRNGRGFATFIGLAIV